MKSRSTNLRSLSLVLLSSCLLTVSCIEPRKEVKKEKAKVEKVENEEAVVVPTAEEEVKAEEADKAAAEITERILDKQMEVLKENSEILTTRTEEIVQAEIEKSQETGVEIDEIELKSKIITGVGNTINEENMTEEDTNASNLLDKTQAVLNERINEQVDGVLEEENLDYIEKSEAKINEKLIKRIEEKGVHADCIAEIAIPASSERATSIDDQLQQEIDLEIKIAQAEVTCKAEAESDKKMNAELNKRVDKLVSVATKKNVDNTEIQAASAELSAEVIAIQVVSQEKTNVIVEEVAAKTNEGVDMSEGSETKTFEQKMFEMNAKTAGSLKLKTKEKMAKELCLESQNCNN